ncbi:MAG: cobyrinate a,c-diamide synthase [Methyloligellaceae bacterium]
MKTVIPKGLVISAPASGTGKTTLMIGLLGALRRAGYKVQPFKSGPDYIDPAFHQSVSGKSSGNLDTWSMSEDLLTSQLKRAEGADIILAEGAMGLYDGAAEKGEYGNGAAAELAKLFGWPVILILDVSGQAQSAAAVAAGFAAIDPEVKLGGVVLNRVASPRHEMLVRKGMQDAGIRVLGALPRSNSITIPERHLGLVQAEEQSELTAILDALADFTTEFIDIQEIIATADGNDLQSSPDFNIIPPGQRIAVAQDVAFSFNYPHLIDNWHKAGAEILPFSPLNDEAPDITADTAWLPGGYPELHCEQLSTASGFKSGMIKFSEKNRVHGECGGYMVLGQAIIDKNGSRHEMLGLLGLVTSFEKRKLHLGYRKAELTAPLFNFRSGTILRGHEYHYSSILAQPDQPLAKVFDAQGNLQTETGSYRNNVSGTFFHFIAPAMCQAE